MLATLPDGQWRDPDRIKTCTPAPFIKAECLFIQESDKHPAASLPPEEVREAMLGKGLELLGQKENR